MGPSVFNVDGVEPYTVHAGRGGVQCPGAENVERYNAVQEEVETSFPGTEGVRTMCYLRGKE